MAPKTDINFYTYANAAQEKLSPYVSSVKQVATVTVVSVRDVVQSSCSTFQTVLDKYPPVKAFFYSFAAVSALPLAFFACFVFITGAILLTIGSTFFAITQGSFMAFGAFVLFWFLLAALVAASIGSFWFTTGYFAFQVRSY
jgi:hypothetical protein